MITTDDEDVARELRSVVNQGRSDNGDWLVHHAARLQLPDGRDVGRGRPRPARQAADDAGRAATAWPPSTASCWPARRASSCRLPGPHERSWFIYYVRLRPGVDRGAVIDAMAARGIASRPYLPAIHLQPEYRARGWREGMLPVTEPVSRSTLALPFFVHWRTTTSRTSCSALREVIEAL